MNARHRCTAEQAAHRLGLPVRTVRRLMSAGILSCDPGDRGLALSVEDVERYASSRRGLGIR
ncbi:MAG: helix-turn-helix domain-containing protein [Microthrixaceae bacterium]